MRALNNTAIPGFAPKSDAFGSPEYAERVAQPTMSAIDDMPREYRAMVNEFGYIDVYRAWRRGITPEAIRQHAKDGIFVL